VEEEKAKKHKKNYQKKSIWVSVLLSFVLIVSVLVHQYLLHRILPPIIKEGFFELSKEKYILNFERINWNVFLGKFSIHELSIVPINDNLSSSSPIKLSKLYTKECEIKGIDYSSTLAGHIKFKALIISQVQLITKLDSALDVVKEEKVEKERLVHFLSSIQSAHLSINHADLLLKRQADTLACVRNLSLEMNGLKLDSLEENHKFYYPEFDNAVISIQDFLLQDTDEIRLQQLEFSTNKNLSNPVIHLNSLSLFQAVSKQKIKIWDADISMKFKDFLKHIYQNKIWGDYIAIKCKSLNMQSKKSLPKESLDQLMEKIFQMNRRLAWSVRFDSLSLDIDSLRSKKPHFSSEISGIDYHSKGVVLDSNTMSNKYWYLGINKSKYVFNRAKDTLAFAQFFYKEKNKLMQVKRISYKQNEKAHIFCQSVELANFDLINSLKNKRLEMDELIMRAPNVRLYKAQKKSSEKKINSFDHLVDINKLKIINASFEDKSKGLSVYKANVSFDSIYMEKISAQNLWNLLLDFQVDVEKIFYNPPNTPINLSVLLASFNSSTGLFKGADIKFLWKPINSTNSMAYDAKDIHISCLEWRALIQHQNIVVLDTFRISQMHVKMTWKDTIRKAPKSNNLFVSSKYFYMPQVNLDILLNNSQNTIQIKAKNAYVESLNLVYDQKSKNVLNTDFLICGAQESFFNSLKDSIVLKTALWKFHSKHKIFEVNNLFVSGLFVNDVKQTNGRLKATFPYVYLEGLDPFLYRKTKEISLDSLMIIEPEMEWQSSRETPFKYQGETKSFYKKFSRFVEKFSLISIKKGRLKDAKISVVNRYIKRVDQVKIAGFNVKIQDFYLDYQRLQKQDKFFFSEELFVEMDDYNHIVNNGQYVIGVERIEMSSASNRLYFGGLSFLSLNEKKTLPINVFLQSLLLKDFSVITQSKQPKLFVGSIFLQTPELWLKFEGKHKVAQPIQSVNLYKAIKQQLSAVQVDYLELNHLGVHLPEAYRSQFPDLYWKGINMQANHILIDSNNHIFDHHKFFYCDDIKVQIPNISYISKNKFYKMGFKSASFSSQSKYLRVDSLSIKPRYSKSNFSKHIAFEKTMIDLLVPELLIENIDYRDMIFRHRYNAQKVYLGSPDISFYKDKTIPFDTTVYRAMPAQLLLDLPFYLNVDTLEIEKGKLSYAEKRGYMDKDGIIFLDNINAKLRGISNDKDFRNFGGAFKMNFSSQLMSQSLLTLNVVCPLNSKEQDFVMIASLAEINAKSFNEILQPVSLASVTSGTILGMQLMAKGNNDFATGDMLLKYKSLRLEVLRKKDLKESFMVSLLANSIIKKNNNSYFRLRKGPVYFERNKHKAFFNYLTHIAISGLKTSVGVEVRKTKKKIKEKDTN